MKTAPILSRQLGQAGHFPAIDVLASASRVFNRVTDRAHQDAALRVRALIAKHDEIRFLLQVGEYAPGSDALADDAIAAQPALQALLRQRPDEGTPFEQTLAALQQFQR